MEPFTTRIDHPPLACRNSILSRPSRSVAPTAFRMPRGQGQRLVSWSADGIEWEKGHALVVQPTAGSWAKDVRTPLGLVDEGDGRLTVFYTGFEQAPDWTRLLRGQGGETCAIGFAELKVSN